MSKCLGIESIFRNEAFAECSAAEKVEAYVNELEKQRDYWLSTCDLRADKIVRLQADLNIALEALHRVREMGGYGQNIIVNEAIAKIEGIK